MGTCTQGKLSGISLKVSKIQDKPNVDKIFKSYLDYCDLKWLHTSLDYLKDSWKNLFFMIKKFDPSTFFVTFTFLERLWEPSIKTLYTLHAKKTEPFEQNKTPSIYSSHRIDTH